MKMRFLVVSAPRCGSTLFHELLCCHHEIDMAGEILNTEDGRNDHLTELTGKKQKVLAYVESCLKHLNGNSVGFKVFYDHLKEFDMTLWELVRHVQAKVVIVLWRENILEAIVSEAIATKTGVWYSTHAPDKVEQIGIKEEIFYKAIDKRKRNWEILGKQWPLENPPVFVKYEDLVADIPSEMMKVFRALSVELDEPDFKLTIKRQNPAPLSEKLVNWNTIPKGLQTAKISVPEIIRGVLLKQMKIPSDLKHLVPDPEPPEPAAGWAYRVAEPFLPAASKENLLDAMESNTISSRSRWPVKMTEAFKEYFHVPVAQPCSNGFTAIVLALQTARISTGDEVIVPTLNMIAVSNAVLFVGAIPVFVDVEDRSYNPGWKQIEEAITVKTKAVILIHLYGVPTGELTLIAEECLNRSLYLIEDISECIGVLTKDKNGNPKHLGTFGDFACGSLYANKIINAGDGGIVLANDIQVEARLASLVNHGFTRALHFLHQEPAINGKINGLGAAVAVGCLEHLDEVMSHRSAVAQWYRAGLEGTPLELMPEAGVGDTPWVFAVRCASVEERGKLREFLAESGVETRNFFVPLHFQPAYNNLQFEKGALKNSEVLSYTGFYLPTHTRLEKHDVDYICSVIKNFFCTSRSCLPLPYSRMPDTPAFFGIHVNPSSLELESRVYDRNGEQLLTDSHEYLLTGATNLCCSFEEALTKENWGNISALLREAKEISEEAEKEGMTVVGKALASYIDYFSCQVSHEQSLSAPWLRCELYASISQCCKHIPTTTETETLQLLVWIIETYKVKTIIEMGSWFGHATLLMTLASLNITNKTKVLALDPFVWQDWMGRFCYRFLKRGNSIKSEFEANMGENKKFISTLEWVSEDEHLPPEVKGCCPDLVFLDFTQEASELEKVWLKLHPHLVQSHTVIVVNSMTKTMLPFLTKYSSELQPIAKPFAKSKAFIFGQRQVGDQYPRRTIRFVEDQDWDHHHLNAFNWSIGQLKNNVHDENATCLFLPAVEDYFCDFPIPTMELPWIGIVHSPPVNDELFYVPDLKRLCECYRYEDWLRQCKGLFTLTTTQANFLKENLPSYCHFPIVTLKYPICPGENVGKYKGIDVWNSRGVLQLVHIGSYARDLEFFLEVRVPKGVQKAILVGDNEMKLKLEAYTLPESIAKIQRLSTSQYEDLLSTSVPMLCLKHEGAGNTIVVECIGRKTPILAPRIPSVVEYLGPDYPLYYDPFSPDLNKILTVNQLEAAVQYLTSLDTSSLSVDYFCRSVLESSPFLSLPVSKQTMIDQFSECHDGTSSFDVTVVICSFKRTHHLEDILNSIWNKQSYKGTYQIIIWNNNPGRSHVVNSITEKYIRVSSWQKSLEVVNSSQNYYCSIRLAMPSLMRSSTLLICDDDIIPGPDFIDFFMKGKTKYPDDVLCIRGHYFLPHEIDNRNPAQAWEDYEFIRFADDTQPEQFVHYVHADACLISQEALMQCASVPMPDPDFKLVDDYWMSFVLSSMFGYQLRKLCVDKQFPEKVVYRTEDSDLPGLALHKKPKTSDAKMRMYIHHMNNRWPFSSIPMKEKSKKVLSPSESSQLKMSKLAHWNQHFVGFNINSHVTIGDVKDLANMGVKYVRIGAVGVKEEIKYELSDLLVEPQKELRRLSNLFEKLGEYGINVVLTLKQTLASSAVWGMIAKEFSAKSNVIGYDLINEPFTKNDEEIHWSEIEDQRDLLVEAVVHEFEVIMKAVREHDEVTPVIIESTYWAHPAALDKLLKCSRLHVFDANIILSVHFYEPQMLTHRNKNRGRFQFPGMVSLFDNEHSEQLFWDVRRVKKVLEKAFKAAENFGMKICIGEYGISREVKGADLYLDTVSGTCKNLAVGCFLYAFRDIFYDSFDYELGTNVWAGTRNAKSARNNPLFTKIQPAIMQ